MQDGKVTDDMVKHLNRYCVTQTLYYYEDFWKDTHLPPLGDPAAARNSPPALKPTPPGHSPPDCLSSSDRAKQTPQLSDSDSLSSGGQETAPVKRSVVDRSLFDSGDDQNVFGKHNDGANNPSSPKSQTISLSDETVTSESSINSDFSSVSPNEGEDVFTVPTTMSADEQTRYGTTSTVSGNGRTESTNVVTTDDSTAEADDREALLHDVNHPVVTLGGETVYASEITHMITVVFVLQAIILKLPQILWKELLEKTGSNVQTLITRLMDEQFEDVTKRESTISKFACNLPRAVSSDKIGLLPRMGGRRGQKVMMLFQSHVFWLYMMIKVLYIVVLLFQGWLLSTFFAFHFLQFGPSLIRKEILKQPISYVTDFPTVVLCNFRSPTLDIPKEGVWVQCVLVFNNFLENMLLIEWLGILVLSITTILSIFTWNYWRWNEQSNVSFIHSLLSVNLHSSPPLPSSTNELKDVVHMGEISEKMSEGRSEGLDWEKELKDREKLKRFIDNFLGADGVFLLRIIQANTNRVVMGELASQLYKVFFLYDAGGLP
ncbi:hypothetical protein ACOMHN_051987 [Nucella lapillus]